MRKLCFSFFLLNQIDPRFQCLGEDLSRQVPNPFLGLVATALETVYPRALHRWPMYEDPHRLLALWPTSRV